MAAAPARLDIAQHFAGLPDPRHPAFRDHHLLGDILVIGLSAVLTGAESWDAIAAFGVEKRAWLLSLGLSLPNGIPSHDTFNRVFAALDPVAFQRCFAGWVKAVCSALGLRHVPIDGKALRGSRGPDGTCLHAVSAWAREQRLTLAQVAVEGKGNEITAIPQLLALLELRGALVSIDAIGCQREIARQIVEAGGDYLLAVKEDQPTLHRDIQAMLDRAVEAGFDLPGCCVFGGEDESGHGRQECRSYSLFTDLSGLSSRDDWPGLEAVLVAARQRRAGGGEVSHEQAFYISSRAGGVEELAGAARGHWEIENSCHWVLDVVFGEDRCRAREGNAAINLGWLRRMALALLRQDQSKGSLPTKRLRAALSDDFRRHLLDLLSEEYA